MTCQNQKVILNLLVQAQTQRVIKERGGEDIFKIQNQTKLHRLMKRNLRILIFQTQVKRIFQEIRQKISR